MGADWMYGRIILQHDEFSYLHIMFLNNDSCHYTDENISRLGQFCMYIAFVVLIIFKDKSSTMIKYIFI